MNALVSTALWLVGKALEPVADGVLQAWDNSKKLGLNVESLANELLLVQATLDNASRKHMCPAMEELLRKLQESASHADDLLDELDYFRIHDQLHGTSEAAAKPDKGCVQALAFNARHTARAVLGLSSSATPAPAAAADSGQQLGGCCAWPCTRPRKERRDSSSTPNTNQADDGKLPPRPSSPIVHEQTPAPPLVFNRVEISERMKLIVLQMKPLRKNIHTLLQTCEPVTVAPSLPIITFSKSIEPKLYGRDDIMDSIIHDMTKGEYHSKDLTVLPIVGPGGIGKTTLIQHIYNDKQVRDHFDVVIWVCVSISFNLNKLLEEIKEELLPVKDEHGRRPQDLIEQRLKSKRFLLVLDDIWECSNEDDWKNLLQPLTASQEQGSMILVTTRFPKIANLVETTNHIDLEGLKLEEFRKLFHAFVFGSDPPRKNLLETGEKIMEKLKRSPLAAKTVGRLLRDNLSLPHWKSVLESKEWEAPTVPNSIMPALKLSYDFLPFHQQQCFSFSALFPEDHKYSSTQLIDFWIGLDILQPGGRDQTLHDIGLRTLTDLVTHGFFREEGTGEYQHYVMHDLLHDLALMVASHECLTVHFSDVRLVKVRPSIRHLSIVMGGIDDSLDDENIKNQLRKLKTELKATGLRTLIIFGIMNESIVSILGDLFREANSLRFLFIEEMSSPVESILPNFSVLVHLRYICLGTKKYSHLHFPIVISRFYHLRFLDLTAWYDSFDFPKDMSNLAKLFHFRGPLFTFLEYGIVNVGKLVLLEELGVFRVNKQIEGLGPEQLEHLTELRELGMYNLENIHTQEEAAKAKLIEKNYLKRLTLVWDMRQSNIEPDVETAILEALQPHRNLEELCIRGHRGRSFPTWLGDKLTVEDLQCLHLSEVSWQCPSSLGKMLGLHTLKLHYIASGREFVIEKSFCSLIRLELAGLENFEKWLPSQDAHMFPLLQVLIIKSCPKLLEVPFSKPNVYPKPDQERNIDWFPKLQELEIDYCLELLVGPIPWTETLCSVNIRSVKLLEKFEYKPKYLYGTELEIEGKDGLPSLDQVLAFSHLTGIKSMRLRKCSPIELKHLVMLTSLKKLIVEDSGLLGGGADVEWQLPVEVLKLKSVWATSGEEFRELLTHLPRLSELDFMFSHSLLVGWHPTPRRVLLLQNCEGGEDQVLSSIEKISTNMTYSYPGMLAAPICSYLSSSLTGLRLYGTTFFYEVERFTKEQEDALHLLASLQLLYFSGFKKLQHLPAGLHKMNNLKELDVYDCPFVRSLPEDGLPESLQELIVYSCGNEELKQQCRGLVGTIPRVRTETKG